MDNGGGQFGLVKDERCDMEKVMRCNGNLLVSTWKRFNLLEVKSAYVMLTAGGHKWLEWGLQKYKRNL